MAIDWKKIRAEYIADPSTSYRTLAAKYGLHPGTIATHGKRGGWPEARDKNQTRKSERYIEATEKKETAALTALQDLAETMATRLLDAVNESDRDEFRTYARDWSAAAKNLRDVMNNRLDRSVKAAQLKQLQETIAAIGREHAAPQLRIEISGAEDDWTE